MRRTPYLLTLILLLLFARELPLRAQSAAELTVFHSPLCSSCHAFLTQQLPALQAAYGDRLAVHLVDVSTADGLAQIEAAEASAGRFSNPLPVLLLGDSLLADEDLSRLTTQLQELLAAQLGPAAVASPVPSLTAGEPSPTPSETAAWCDSKCQTDPPIHVAYISKPYCAVCDRTQLVLEVVAQDYPQMVIHRFDQAKDAGLLEAMARTLGLPEERRLIAPSLYVGDEALVGEGEVTATALRAILQRYASTGAPEFWTELDTEAASQGILARFRGLSVAAVAVAGLIDGVNPCAFATILFFVSYLAVGGRSRRDMLLVGGAFTLGVLITYFAVGLGAMRLLAWVNAARGVGLVLYGLMALACLVLALLSLRDYALARQGNLSEMALNLPDKWRAMVHRRIRAGRGASVGAALATGVFVSLVELACTGQVYLPTISYVMGVQSMRRSALGYLALYNLAFVLPLVGVLLAAAWGVSTRRFQRLFTQHAASTKLAMAALFGLLAILLATRLATL